VSSLAVAKTNSRRLVDDMIASKTVGLTEWDELRTTGQWLYECVTIWGASTDILTGSFPSDIAEAQ